MDPGRAPQGRASDPPSRPSRRPHRAILLKLCERPEAPVQRRGEYYPHAEGAGNSGLAGHRVGAQVGLILEPEGGLGRPWGLSVSVAPFSLRPRPSSVPARTEAFNNCTVK